MNDNVVSAYNEARHSHETIFMRLIELKKKLPKTIEDACDSVYALKETAGILDDIRKEVNKHVEMLEKLCCIMWVTRGELEPIRTKFCTGTPDQKQTVKTPKPGTPEYDAFCEFFGVPGDTPFRPHWPSMLEKISEMAVAGEKLPPGCDPKDMMTQYRVTIRNKRPIVGKTIVDADLLREMYEAVYAAEEMTADELKDKIMVLKERQLARDLSSDQD